MPDRDLMIKIAERTLALAKGADQAQVTVNSRDDAYARFARNYIVQNLDGQELTVTLTYVKDKHLGTATSGNVADAGLSELVATAADIARRVPANREFVSLVAKQPIAKPVKSVYASTAGARADDRVRKLLPVFTRMHASDLRSAGFTTTRHDAIAVANSLGVRAYHEATYSGLEIKAMAPATSGFAEYFSRDYATLDPAVHAERAAHKATVSRDPQDLAPGTYTVVLEPPAFVDCINSILAQMNAGSVLEDKTSWMAGRIGKQIFSPNVTVVDDWSHPLVANQPFADDGAPTKKITLVDKGVPKNFVSSTFEANKFKIPNTGHSDGYPINTVVMPGTKSHDQLIASVERGVLVSRTWYTRAVDPHEGVITGLTRDGVFLIENGKLTKTLKNFRFYTSMLTALADIELGDTLYLAESADTPGTLAVPDAKIAKFAFSAQTSFA